MVAFLNFVLKGDSLLDFHPFLNNKLRLIHKLLQNTVAFLRRKGSLKTFSFESLGKFIVEVLLVLVIILVGG